VRERIEDALSPQAEPRRKAKEVPDPDQVLDEVTEFVSLARDAPTCTAAGGCPAPSAPSGG
jgi:hypothetical protein